MFMVRNGIIVDCNNSAVSMLGYRDKEDVINVLPEELSAEYQPDGKKSSNKSKEMMQYAFEKGAPIVLVSGCHFADCHYIDANRWTQKRVEKLWDKMERWGIRPERLQMEWISAAEGQKWKRTMFELEEMRKQVSDEEVVFTMNKLTEEREKDEIKKAAKEKRKQEQAETEISEATIN